MRVLVRAEIIRQFHQVLCGLLTVQDICIRLKICEKTFRRRRGQWKFPAPLICEGNFVRWSIQQIELWETSRHVKKI
jgi:hypothetical protein